MSELEEEFIKALRVDVMMQMFSTLDTLGIPHSAVKFKEVYQKVHVKTFFTGMNADFKPAAEEIDHDGYILLDVIAKSGKHVSSFIKEEDYDGAMKYLETLTDGEDVKTFLRTHKKKGDKEASITLYGISQKDITEYKDENEIA